MCSQGSPMGMQCGDGSNNGGFKPASQSYSGMSNQTFSGSPGYPRNPRNECCIPCCHEPILPRCPDGNFVAKVCSMRPDIYYMPPEHPFDDRTTNKTDFNWKISEKSGAFKPKFKYHKSSGILENESLYKKDYIPFPTTPYQKPDWSKKAQFKQSEGLIVDTTTYKSTFVNPYGGDPQKSFKPKFKFELNKQPLDARTTYGTDFVPYCKDECARKTMAPNAEASVVLGVPLTACAFTGMSIYKSDYVPVIAGGGKRIPKKNYLSRRMYQPMQGNSVYRADYEPFYFTKKCHPCMPGEVYDQLYKGDPCAHVNCCPQESRYEVETPVAPPLPSPKTCNSCQN